VGSSQFSVGTQSTHIPPSFSRFDSLNHLFLFGEEEIAGVFSRETLDVECMIAYLASARFGVSIDFSITLY
jgi:hypothetical protein